MVLEQVCRYFYHRLKHEARRSPDAPTSEFNISPELALPLLMASNFLFC